jgi:hypothetical protein
MTKTEQNRVLAWRLKMLRDLLRRGVADQATLVRLVEQCAAISDPSDGVIFEPATISVEPIRDATELSVLAFVSTRVSTMCARPCRSNRIPRVKRIVMSLRRRSESAYGRLGVDS